VNLSDAKKVAGVLWESLCSPTPVESDPGSEAAAPVLQTPLMIPSFGNVFRRFNRSSISRVYQKVCKTHGVDSPILLTTFPSTVDFVKSADADLKVYYCVDDWQNYPGLDHARIGKMERELFDAVDAMVATSRRLEEKKSPGCPSLYLPQGADFEHFHHSEDGYAPVPELAEFKTPVVGFFGFISNWIDLDLIVYLSREFPDVSFLVVGDADVPTRKLEVCPNVHRTGAVPYAELPNWANQFDVGLIPFLLNDLTKAVNPLKLMEYFALGLPVLSTRLPDLEDSPGPLFMASTHEEFAEHFRQILDAGASSFSDEAVAVAREHSWQTRAETLSSFLQGQL
jgi:glycosyltransferase involved in cell wall biosynthesis